MRATSSSVGLTNTPTTSRRRRSVAAISAATPGGQRRTERGQKLSPIAQAPSAQVAEIGSLVTLRFSDDEEDQQFLIGLVEQASSGVEVITPTSPLGAVLLGAPGTGVNAVGQLSGSAGTDQDFTFRDADGFTVAAPGITATGGEVDLSTAAGGIAQTTGARITADRLTVTVRVRNAGTVPAPFGVGMHPYLHVGAEADGDVGRATLRVPARTARRGRAGRSAR